jgi:hypothetical protein
MIKWTEKPGLAEALGNAGLNCYQLDNKWVADDPEAVQRFIDDYEPSESLQKLIGVEFEGVMCSASSQDQAGLMAVLLSIQMQGAAFKPTQFEFENGSKLVISLGNYQQFITVWMPFRQSFFVAN